MASVNWGGNHGSARCSKADHVKGINLLKHCDQKFRSDPDRQHSNEEIDPSKSYLNQNFTGMDWKTSKEKWEKRLKELDATVSQTQRKDRIELTSLEIGARNGSYTGMPTQRSIRVTVGDSSKEISYNGHRVKVRF